MWIRIVNKFANVQNFTQKKRYQSENIPKSFRGARGYFLKHPVYNDA